MQLPALRYPNNALLNLAPINQGLDAIRQGADTQFKVKREDERYQAGQQRQGRLDQERTATQDRSFGLRERQIAGQESDRLQRRAIASETLGMRRQEFDSQQEARQQQIGQRRAKSLGGLAQMVQLETDPARRAQLWERVIQAEPGMIEALPEQFRGVDGGPEYLISLARGYVEPKTVDLNAGRYKDAKQNADVERDLRKEYAALAKPYFKVRDSYGRIMASGKEPSAAGDLALIFNYMKILDPGSVVRESEFATAQNAAGVPDRVRAMFNNILNGERLAPAVRGDFLQQSSLLFASQKNQYDKLQSQYSSIARGLGLNVGRVILDYGLPQGGQEGNGAQFLNDARTAIAGGADRNEVIEALRADGIDPGGL